MLKVKICWIALIFFFVPASFGQQSRSADASPTDATRTVVVRHQNSGLDNGEVLTRIKDIARVGGVRENQLIGYGLVAGLATTGDDQRFTDQSLRNLLERFNITANLNEVEPDNVAAVMVTASMPPFASEGTRLDVTVSSIGDTKSLQGGTLLLTELKGVDGKVYALAQGPVSIGGFVVRTGGGGQQVQKNHSTVGKIPGGAIVEFPVGTQFILEGFISLVLESPDFTTARNIQDSINQYFKTPGLAQALDPGTVRVNLEMLSSVYPNPVSLISELERVPVRADTTARVVINERTGTVVAGHRVRISTVAISHGPLTIQIEGETRVSQPLPFSEGETVVYETDRLHVNDPEAPLQVLKGEGATVEDLVRAFQALEGTLSPRDLIAIFQALKEAGALKAELVIM